MVDGGGRPRFSKEPGRVIRGRKLGAEGHLDRHLAAELGVERAIDAAERPGAEHPTQFEATDSLQI